MLNSLSLVAHGQLGPVLLIVLLVLNLVVTLLRLILTLARLTQILARIGEWMTSLSSDRLHSLIERVGTIIHEVQQEGARHGQPARHPITAPLQERQV